MEEILEHAKPTKSSGSKTWEANSSGLSKSSKEKFTSVGGLPILSSLSKKPLSRSWQGKTELSKHCLAGCDSGTASQPGDPDCRRVGIGSEM